MTDIAGNAPKTLQKSWGWFFALGILLIIGGLLRSTRRSRHRWSWK